MNLAGENLADGRWSADDFVPRALFGEFVNELVAKELAAAGGRASLARDACASSRAQGVPR